jgi:nicotinate-nucleotide--dimethylbenzimidazole phosphoribosyltransferase
MKWSCPPIAEPSPEIARAAAAEIDQKTKPLGSLGRLEALAQQIGAIQGTLRPSLASPAVLVFAGDHGLTEEGVSLYPQAVTAQMVLNFLRGGAAISVFARQHGLALHVIDAGVAAAEPFAWKHIQDAKLHLHAKSRIRPGTRNALHEPAMTNEELDGALGVGDALVSQLSAEGSNAVLFGEMGIGNTSAAALLMSALFDLPVAQCVGRGTGLDDAGIARKIDVLARVLARHAPELAHARAGARGGAASGTEEPGAASHALAALKCLGGYELAMTAGAMLRAAAQRMVIVNDGFITSAALAVAAKIEPRVLRYVVASHQSAEAAHARLLGELGLSPLLNLQLRLGEGTGAALAWPLIQSAVGFLNEMATFASAGVSEA